MATRAAAVILSVALCAGCSTTPVMPSGTGVNPTDAAGINGQLAVSFLNRFAASSVSPDACIVDFAASCPGKADERSDIAFNRAHYEILGARLGAPSVQIAGDQASANIALSCAFDSRITKCETADCVEGSFDHVTGTCTLRSIFAQSRWWLCDSHFSGSGSNSPPMKIFFGLPR